MRNGIIAFEWDEAKNQANRLKHGLGFEKASELFDDPFQLSVLGRVLDGEQRWETYGVVDGTVLVMAVHTIDEEIAGSLVEVVRIISARRANRKEKRIYEDENR